MQGHGINHWKHYPRSWSQVKAPLRPNEEVVSAFAELVGQNPSRTLLLGVTPELAALFNQLDAMDKNIEMIKTAWPGDTETRKAVVGNWLNIPLSQGSYSIIVGDGSLNMMDSSAAFQALNVHIYALLEAGGLFACRTFERPATPFTDDDLSAVINGSNRINFHAFKWMLAMYRAHQYGMRVRVGDILADFEMRCPDRESLSRATGWPLSEIETIDIYRGSEVAYVFPSRDEFVSALPDNIKLGFLKSGTYDLADCCPIIFYQK